MGYELVRLGLGRLSSDAFFALAGARPVKAKVWYLFDACKAQTKVFSDDLRSNATFVYLHSKLCITYRNIIYNIL